MKVGHVPQISYCRPGDPIVAEKIKNLIVSRDQRGQVLKAVLCERLGPQVWGDSAASAMATLEELEETAKLWLRGGCTASPLSSDEIEVLRQQFNISW
jgi:ribulose-5-phosphate 4-epimerase/fuculose-1-phosphate aldolase